jgi:hypothetical protein
MAKMAGLHAEGMTDKELNEPYEIPIKYIEEDEWEQADLDGWPEDKKHPPEVFRDKANGE